MSALIRISFGNKEREFHCQDGTAREMEARMEWPLWQWARLSRQKKQ